LLNGFAVPATSRESPFVKKAAMLEEPVLKMIIGFTAI